MRTMLSPGWIQETWNKMPPDCQLRELLLDQLHYYVVVGMDIYKAGSPDANADCVRQLREFMDDGELGHALLWRTLRWEALSTTEFRLD